MTSSDHKILMQLELGPWHPVQSDGLLGPALPRPQAPSVADLPDTALQNVTTTTPRAVKFLLASIWRNICNKFGG